MRTPLSFSIATLLLAIGCSSSDKATVPGATGGADPGSTPDETGGSAMSSAGKGGSTGVSMPPRTGSKFAGAECPTDLGLPDAFGLPNVNATVDGSTVRITFDPQGDAKDYRVYALPAAEDVSGTTVKGATYRCAGRTAVPWTAQEDADSPAGGTAVSTRINTPVNGFSRTTADATLGYVFTTAAADRIPVYALGDPNIKAENLCYEMRWQTTRVKKYTSSEAERKQLLAQHWRDDGIAFYAPKPDADGSEVISSADEANPGDYSPKYYLKAGAEYDKRAGSGMVMAPAFSVYSAMREGAEPLMRAYYRVVCGRGHDELATGIARFNTAVQQGDQPVTELHFSGLSKETTLVVEALDDLCPFPGIIAPQSRPARNNDTLQGVPIEYPKFQTPDELRAASPTGELFVGGQGDGTAPKAISRACVKVKPESTKADWSYSGEVETFADPVTTTFQSWNQESPTFNVEFYNVASDEFTVGSLFNELWVTYADWAADTNGKFRLTPKTHATLSDSEFVHATMEVDMISTQRRYPQLLISDVEVPVQANLEQGGTVITQIFGGVSESVQLQLQFCDHRSWDVNNQCPKFELDRLKDDSGGESLRPHPEVNSFFGIDRTVRFDVYTSTSRSYVFTNGIPYGCADLPAGKLKAGQANVVFGDVLYHSDADLKDWYPFHLKRLHNVTSRHFSNLGFTSNVMAPDWDEARMPCAPAADLEQK